MRQVTGLFWLLVVFSAAGDQAALGLAGAASRVRSQTSVRDSGQAQRRRRRAPDDLIEKMLDRGHDISDAGSDMLSDIAHGVRDGIGAGVELISDVSSTFTEILEGIRRRGFAAERRRFQRLEALQRVVSISRPVQRMIEKIDRDRATALEAENEQFFVDVMTNLVASLEAEIAAETEFATAVETFAQEVAADETADAANDVAVGEADAASTDAAGDAAGDAGGLGGDGDGSSGDGDAGGSAGDGSGGDGGDGGSGDGGGSGGD